MYSVCLNHGQSSARGSKSKMMSTPAFPLKPAASASCPAGNGRSCTCYCLWFILKLPLCNNHLLSKENCFLGNLSCYTHQAQVLTPCSRAQGGPSYFLRAMLQASEALVNSQRKGSCQHQADFYIHASEVFPTRGEGGSDDAIQRIREVSVRAALLDAARQFH